MSRTVRVDASKRRKWYSHESKTARKMWQRRNRARLRSAVTLGEYDAAASDARRTSGWMTH